MLMAMMHLMHLSCRGWHPLHNNDALDTSIAGHFGAPQATLNPSIRGHPSMHNTQHPCGAPACLPVKHTWCTCLMSDVMSMRHTAHAAMPLCIHAQHHQYYY